MTICLFFKKKNAGAARRESETAKGKIGMELCLPSESELLEEKKQRGKTGKAYQTGFQITEVIPSVIDSPIATYRISVGSSWEGNYKGEETRREMDRGSERKRARCVGRSGKEERNRKITEKADVKKKKGNGTLRKVVLSTRIQLDDREINWLLSDRSLLYDCYYGRICQSSREIRV